MAVPEAESRSLWVFGYGSLCWMPGFQYGRSSVGYIRHYVRRFWQGNTTHRGTPEKPGRVATLVEENEGSTWGVAYELQGEAALKYLEGREVTLGGYTTTVTTFYPRDTPHPHHHHPSAPQPSPFPVLLFLATPASPGWAGRAPLHEIASQVVQCRGDAGHNVEYVLRLAEFIKSVVPEGYDDHLRGLESLVRRRVKDNNMCLKALMGDGNGNGNAAQHVAQGGGGGGDGGAVVEPRRDTFQYSTSLPPKKLRCLNV